MSRREGTQRDIQCIYCLQKHTTSNLFPTTLSYEKQEQHMEALKTDNDLQLMNIQLK